MVGMAVAAPPFRLWMPAIAATKTLWLRAGGVAEVVSKAAGGSPLGAEHQAEALLAQGRLVARSRAVA